jgi:hypothetical protein
MILLHNVSSKVEAAVDDAPSSLTPLQQKDIQAAVTDAPSTTSMTTLLCNTIQAAVPHGPTTLMTPLEGNSLF